MIEVKCFPDGFLIKGHAEYAPHGQDIVCASISAIALAIATEIEEKGLGRYETRPGYLDCTFWANDASYATNLVGMLYRTSKKIAEDYPGFVKVME